MDEIKIEYLPVSELNAYERNARKHGEEDVSAIVESIKEFGFNDPIGLWSDKNVIVEGHGRLLAAKLLGLETVPCIHLDHLTDEQRRGYALAHNKTAENSEWDMPVLESELRELEKYFDMTDFGFDAPSDNNSIAEAIDLTEPSDKGKDGIQCHCPKCGFVFEVNP